MIKKQCEKLNFPYTRHWKFVKKWRYISTHS